MSMLIGMLMKFSKHLFFGSFLFVYLMSYYKLISITTNLYNSSMPNKYIVYSGIVIGFIHLIVLYLVFKIHFEKGYFSSLIWASITHIVFGFAIGGIAYLIFQSNFILFDFDIKALLTDTNYNTKFEKIDKEFNLTSEQLYEIKKSLMVYMYMLFIILVIDSLAIYKMYKTKALWFS